MAEVVVSEFPVPHGLLRGQLLVAGHLELEVSAKAEVIRVEEVFGDADSCQRLQRAPEPELRENDEAFVLVTGLGPQGWRTMDPLQRPEATRITVPESVDRLGRFSIGSGRSPHSVTITGTPEKPVPLGEVGLGGQGQLGAQHVLLLPEPLEMPNTDVTFGDVVAAAGLVSISAANGRVLAHFVGEGNVAVASRYRPDVTGTTYHWYEMSAQQEPIGFHRMDRVDRPPMAERSPMLEP